MASISRIERSSSTTRMRGARRSAATSVAVVLMSRSVFPSLCGYSGPLRQMHGHGGPAIDLGADLNLAVVVGHDAVDDGQPEAAALRKSPVKRLEQAVEIVGRDTDAL